MSNCQYPLKHEIDTQLNFSRVAVTSEGCHEEPNADIYKTV